MARYIDADKLKEAFSTDTQHLSTFDPDLYDLIVLDIDEAPTADVKEVKRGHWIAKASTHTSKRGRLIHYDRYKCSECGVWNGRHKQDFCPHCGADMRKPKNDKE